ncbi:MAG TPA: glycosyltransferase [Polyangia bacterium]|nr:glycosyltransferase [Polyangia bacterium]
MLRPNLEALARRDPELVQRIGWPVESDHVVLDDSGEVVYRLHQGRYRLSLSEEAVARALPPAAPEGSEIFVFGVGLGETIDAVLTLAAPARPDLRVVAWERDPWLLRLALARNDWAAALASGRLRLLLGSDLVEAAVATGGRVARGPTVFHPFLGTVYRQERSWLAPETAGRPLALLCAGGLFSDDLASALGAAGQAVYTIDVRRLAREELDRTVTRLRPELIAAINYTDGLAEFAAAHRCKLICWEVDPTTSAPPRYQPADPAGGNSDGAFLFTYRRAQVDELRAGGFRRVEYLPLAADLARRTPVPLTGADRARYGAPVSFVGSSLQPQISGFRQSFLTNFAAGQPGGVTQAAMLLDEVLAEQRRDFSRDVIAGALARRCPDLARADPQRLAQLGRWAGEIAAAEKRLVYLAPLGRFGARVWGDEGWRALNPDGLASEVQYQGPAGHGLELTKIYCATQINVDVGRLYQSDIVTMRVFDVLACGGFVLAERSAALAELFEIGVEVDCYATADELTAKVAHYLAHPAAAHAIALRGRAAVQQRHTIAARVARMLAVSGARPGNGDRAQVVG